MSNAKNAADQHASELLNDAATRDSAETLKRLGTTPAGLHAEEAAERLDVFGPNEVGHEKKHEWLRRLYHAVRNPLVILLTLLATVSYVTDDFVGGTIMMVMVFLGISLRFVQETRADKAAAKLKAMISVTATVLRDGQATEIPLAQLVPGDIVKLSAGDMIPGRRAADRREGPVHHPGHADGRIAAGGKDRRARIRARTFRPSSAPTSVFSAPAWKAARPRR